MAGAQQHPGAITEAEDLNKEAVRRFCSVLATE